MNDPTLVSLIVRRLCHDFAGPIGAVTTALDMLSDGNDPELVALVADGAAGLSASLRLYRFALAPGKTPIESGTARALFFDWAKSRDGLVLDWQDEGEWPAGVAELTAGLAVVAAETASRGGRLTVVAGEARLVAATVRAEATLGDVLAGTLMPDSTELAVAGVLARQASAIGLKLRLIRDESGLTLGAYQAS